MIHGDVGAPQYVRDARVACRRGGDTGERAHLDDPFLEQQRSGHRLQDGLGQRVGELHIFGMKRQGDCEFVAAEAGDDRLAAQCISEGYRHCFQQPVAGFIAVLVVDELEPVNLEGDDDEVVAALGGFDA